jgi:hypothetical protein
LTDQTIQLGTRDRVVCTSQLPEIKHQMNITIYQSRLIAKSHGDPDHMPACVRFKQKAFRHLLLFLIKNTSEQALDNPEIEWYSMI